MDMTQLGVVATLIIPIGSVVKTAVDIAIINLKLQQPYIYAMNYSLCIILMLMLAFALYPITIPLGLQAVIGGMVAANYAALQTDTHNAARSDGASLRGRPDSPIVTLNS